MSRPVILTVLSGALLLAVAAPALRLRTGTTDIAGLPSTIDGIAGIKLINEKFPFGQDIRMDVVVTNPNDPGVATAIQALLSRVDALEGMGAGQIVRTADDGHAALVSFPMTGNRNDEANRAIVTQVRDGGRSRALCEPGATWRPGRPRGSRRLRLGPDRPDDGHRRDLLERDAEDLRLRARAVVPADAARVPLDRDPDQGDPAEPAVNGRGVRRRSYWCSARAGSRTSSASRRAASSRAGSRSSSSRSCSACRWTTTCSSSRGSRRRAIAGWICAPRWRAGSP